MLPAQPSRGAIRRYRQLPAVASTKRREYDLDRS
jgi:hypothetical protein